MSWPNSWTVPAKRRTRFRFWLHFDSKLAMLIVFARASWDRDLRASAQSSIWPEPKLIVAGFLSSGLHSNAHMYYQRKFRGETSVLRTS